MEAKVKEEVPDKDYQPSTTERRKWPPYLDLVSDLMQDDQEITGPTTRRRRQVRVATTTGKERRSPEQEEARTSPTPGPPSPSHNGTAASSTESLSPPLEGSRSAPALQRLRRFLSALQQFATDTGADTADRVRQLIYNLVAGSMTIDEFQTGVQECTNYPLRASVPGFLRALLPLAQRDLQARARRAKQTPQQFIRSHEHLILESGGDGTDIFQQQTPAETAVKRRASDPFYDAQTNGSHEEYAPHAKRPPPASLFLNPSFMYPGGNAGLFDYGHAYHGYHGQGEPAFERRDGGISVRDVSSMNAPFSEPRLAGPGALLKTDDEWRNINTMLNCILSMVEKTKRALAILQQRGSPNCPGAEPPESTDIKRAASEIMASAVRQTEERVAEVRRRAEDAVNQVKRQALLELQRAVGAAETKALEIAAERGNKRHTPPPPRDLSPGGSSQQNCCWNCGRKAQETCSGCNAARYCGAFCQHKDWENHHQVCSGRDLKPTALLRTSPPSTLKTLPRAATPITATTTQTNTTTSDRLLPLTTLPMTERSLASISQERTLASERLINPERLISQGTLASERMNPERTLSAERMTLASLSTAQGLIGIGKK